MEEMKRADILEKEIASANGGRALALVLLGYVMDIAVFVFSIFLLSNEIFVSGGILLPKSFCGSY